jgi:hypothetical protein
MYPVPTKRYAVMVEKGDVQTRIEFDAIDQIHARTLALQWHVDNPGYTVVLPVARMEPTPTPVEVRFWSPISYRFWTRREPTDDVPF